MLKILLAEDDQPSKQFGYRIGIDDYITKPFDLEELKRLDNLVKSIPTTVGLIVGIIGVLLFGTGMAFFLEITNVWYLGIPFSIIGVIVMAITPIIHNKLLNKYKKKYGPRIIELSNKLLEE